MLPKEGNHACGRFSCHCLPCMIAIDLYDESLRCLLCFENLSEVWADQVSNQSLQICQTSLGRLNQPSRDLSCQSSGSAGPHACDQVQSMLLDFLHFHHTESTCSGNESLSCPQVGLRWFRDISAHRTCAASLPAHWDASDHLVLRSHLHVPSHGHRAAGGKIPKRWIFHACTHLLSKSLNNGIAICSVHLALHTWISGEVHTSCLLQLLALRWEALWISCALVFHRSARGICPTNQVSVVHRGSTSVWSPTMRTAASLLRDAVCLKTKNLQVAGLQAVWRPLYLLQPACFWNSGDLGHLCLYQAIWSWSGVSRFLQSIVQSALASILPVCEDDLAFSTSSLGSTPPLTSSTYRSSHSGSTVGISGTGPALYASTAFSSPLSSSSLFKHLSTALTSCGGYFAACWAMPPIKWMWRCHGAPPVLLVHSVSNSFDNPGWFVIHPVSLRTKPVPCRPRRSVAVMPHLHIGPRTTYTSALEDIRSTLSSFQLVAPRGASWRKYLPCWICFSYTSHDVWRWCNASFILSDLWKQMAWRTACDQQGLFTVYQLVKEFHVRCLAEVPVLTILLCLTKMYSEPWLLLVLLRQRCEAFRWVNLCNVCCCHFTTQTRNVSDFLR